MKRSRCCNYPVSVVWDMTKHYVCDWCKEPCDAMNEQPHLNDPISHNINQMIKKFSIEKKVKTSDISDGYHTFWELYKHRFHLYIALCKTKLRFARQEMDCEMRVVRSKIHEDWLNVWEEWGMFLLCIHTPYWQISYHLDKEYWDECYFANTEEKATIPFDGHSADDVLDRLLKI